MSAKSGPNVNAASDSDVIIDWLQGHPDAVATISSYTAISVSIVTWIEVMVGARTPEREDATRAAFRLLTVVPLSPEIAEAAVLLRRSARLKLPDATILATARHLGLPLLTRNTKDFSASDPDIIIPYRI